VKPPRLRGRALQLARVAAESGSTLVSNALKASLGIDKIKALPADVRGDVPMSARPVRAKAEPRALDDQALGPITEHAFPPGARAFCRAYLEERSSPVAVAERALAALEKLSRGRDLNVLTVDTRAIALADARASTERYRQAKPKGPLDGVPFLVKDEFDVEGTATTLGSACESTAPKSADATPVARLRSAGAICLGKTVLTEWGMSPLGQNPHQTMPHNAHHRNRVPGGSSTGSAVGVALGLAAIALGGDGGGSIRVPSSLNGVFGIKPTFGRVSRAGDGFKGTVAHAGPIGASVTDLAVALDLTASEPDPLDELTAWAPPPPKGGFGARIGAGVKGLRIAVAETEWEDAAPDVAKAGKQALAELERAGAILVPTAMPLAKVAAPIGYFSISCESLAAVRDKVDRFRSKLADDLRVSYAVADGITAAEFLDAQRLRTALREELAKILRSVDVVALPTTATTAPILEDVDRFSTFSDPTALDAMCRFSFLGNLTGLPAATAPVGADLDGLPIGLQILGDAWDEHIVLGVLAQLERSGVAVPRRSPFALDLL
jgi:aspartyl-tRNA(Asn)/glutamyl-tRNA(Gln) amidotransferase subunit A